MIDLSFTQRLTVVGMLHAPALPGSSRWGGDWQAVEARVLADAKALAEGGVHAVILENFFDAPFFKNQVQPVTVAAMTRLAMAVKQTVDLPLGINMLRNDALSAMSVASAAGADFIRVNVLSGAMVTDQGIVEGQAAELARLRVTLRAESIKILADVAVKHAAPLVQRPLSEQVDELVERAGADAVIVSGTGTGMPTDVVDVQAVKAASKGRPVLVGSGVTPETVGQFLPWANGIIVGTGVKHGGQITNPVEVDRVHDFMNGF